MKKKSEKQIEPLEIEIQIEFQREIEKLYCEKIHFSTLNINLNIDKYFRDKE